MCMEINIKGRKGDKRKLIELLVPSLLKQLRLERSNKTLFISLDANCPHSGLANKISDDFYVVTINSNQQVKDIGITLAHELVHIKQMVRGQLKTNGRSEFWMGKRYSSKTSYMNRPWELEAFAKQEIMFRRALESSPKS
jgi:hypothetical protein